MKHEIKITNLTDIQMKGITSSSKKVCVVACAGSGKTTVLVEKYVRLVLEEGVDPADILAITYTEKAANNLRERLIRRFQSLPCSTRIRQLEGAQISTIHGFCKSVLEKFPLELGISPQFRILDQGESEILKLKAFEIVMSEPQNDRVNTFLGTYGYEVLRDLIFKVSLNRKTHGAQINLGDSKDAERIFKEVKLDFEKTLEEMISITNSDKRSFGRKESVIQNTLGWLRKKNSAKSDETEIKEMISRLKTIGTSQKYPELIKNFKLSLKKILSLSISDVSFEDRSLFLGLLERFEFEYENLKKEGKCLDFEDLIFLTQKLLNDFGVISEEAQALLDKQFKNILIDEFQDTNRLQMSIVSSFAKRAKLFIVGDARQSIYGFRGADVSVMQTVETSFKDSKEGEVVSLDKNFRSNEKVIHFINEFFKAIQEGSSEVYPEMDTDITNDSIEFPIQALLTPLEKETDDNLDATRFREAEKIAEEVKRHVKQKTLIRSEKGDLRPIQYSDFAMLFRAMSHVGIYEYALRKRNIPYYLLKAGGFYGRNEIKDLINFLTLLERPYDNVYTIAVLRSPLFLISNDTLFFIAQIRNQKKGNLPFFYCLRDALKEKKIFPSEKDKLRQFLAIFDQLFRNKDKIGIFDLLDLLDQKTNFTSKMILSEEGERKYANIRKLFEMAKQFDSNESFSLADFITYIETMVQKEVQEEEANLELEAKDAVKISTIHRAKGLEFPAVILADMGMKTTKPNVDRFQVNRKGKFGGKIWVESAQDFIEDYFFIQNKEEEAEWQKEEDRRLLYVALTRAKDLLVLSGAFRFSDKLREKTYSQIENWMGLVAKFFNLSPKNSENNLEIPSFSCRVSFDSPTFSRPINQKAIDKERRKVFESNLLKIENLEADHLNTSKNLIQSVSELPLSILRSRSFTVSQVVTLLESAATFVDRFENPLPQFLLSSKENPKSTKRYSKSESSAKIGDLFHQIASRTNPFQDSEKEVLRREKHLLQSLEEGEKEVLLKCIQELVSDQFKDFLNSEKVKAYHQEIPFAFKIEKKYLRGQIDLLVQYEDSLLILDYKTATARLTPQEIPESYERQMLLYALAAHQIFPEKNIWTCLFYPFGSSYNSNDINMKELYLFEGKVKERLQELDQISPFQGVGAKKDPISELA